MPIKTMDPVIEQRLLIMISALILALIFVLMAWSKRLFDANTPRKIDEIPLKFTDVLKVFGVFLLIELIIVPCIALLWTYIYTGKLSATHQLFMDSHIQGWFNLLTIVLASLGVISYGLVLDPLKISQAFWGVTQPSASNVFKNLGIGSLTWLFSYPFVILIGQIAGIMTTLLGYTKHIEQVAVKNLRETMQFPILFAFTVLAVIFLVPVCEEILFRGYFQKWLSQKKGRVIGIVLTSLVFASFHFSVSQDWNNIELLVSLFTLSCFLGYIYEKRTSLWAPIGLHMTFNAISIGLLLLTPPAAIKAQDETKQPPPSKEMIENFMHSTIEGNNAFAFELYSRLTNTGGNICFSPYSISAALALPFTGTKGATQGDMRVVMHYLNQVSQVIQIYGMLDKLYSTPWYLGPNESKVFLGNSLWIQRDVKILPRFLDTLPALYRPLIKPADFSQNPEGTRLNINSWVKEKTQGRIPQLILKEDFSQDSQMLLISSIFMKGVWSTPFNPSLTNERPFFVDSLTTISVKMMLTSGKFRLYKNSDFTVLELPFRPDYKGLPTLALIIVLPSGNFGLASIEQKLYSEQWSSWMAQLKEEGVIVSIPSFSFLQSFDLTQLLKSMGMSFAFSDKADFTDLSLKENLSLSRVLHGAYLTIDEKGSEAISANPLALNQQTFLSNTSTNSFTADHPFIYLVVDSTTNLIIYLGRYIKP